MTKTPKAKDKQSAKGAKTWLDGPKIWPSWPAHRPGEGELSCGGSPTEDDLAELLKAFRGYSSRYGPPLTFDWTQKEMNVPTSLLLMLSKLVDWNVNQLPWTQERKDWLRAALVAQEHAAGKTLEEAFGTVAERLTEGETVNGIKGEPGPAAARDEMVKKSYYKVMAEQRPRRTRTRKPRQ
jgi:hypothetical protein